MRAGIRTRLLGSFGIVLVFVALIGGLSLYQMGQATGALHDVADEEVAGLTAAFEIRTASLSLQRDLRTLVLAFTPDEKQKVKESMDATDRVFAAQIAALDATLHSDDERQLLEKLGAAHTNGPSPQSREPPMRGKYGVKVAICCGFPKVCPPSVDLTTRIPSTWLGLDMTKDRHET